MSSTATTAEPRLLTARARLPRHVVYRPLPAETVVLNLNTGLYHGLTAAAGRMLRALETSATVAGAVRKLQAELPDAAGGLEDDVLGLCRDLATRGLITFEYAAAA